MGDFNREQTVVCRKPHTCDWCGEGIEAGQQAVSGAGMFEGEFYSYHIHPECAAAIARDSDIDDMWPPEYQRRGMTQRETDEAWVAEDQTQRGE